MLLQFASSFFFFNQCISGHIFLIHASHNGCYACVHKVHILACESGKAAGTRHSRGSELVIRGERIDSDTEFLILASNGIWEVSCNVNHYIYYNNYILQT